MNLLIFLLIFILMHITNGEANWDKEIKCPNQCVCQHAHFMDLSIARWIKFIESRSMKSTLNADNSYDFKKQFSAQQEKNEKESLQENQAYYEDDDSNYTNNPYLKFVMCMLQSNSNPTKLLSTIPQDVQALVLLYYGINKNITIATSDIAHFHDLTTLEIRGTQGLDLSLLIDEPLPSLQHANFEAIQLGASELLKRRPVIIDPSEKFDYVPNSERYKYNISLEIEEEIEILPYDIYKMEIERSRIPTFYGWEALKVLRIHDCKLDELHWELFDGLDNLKHLSLEHNSIKIIPPFAFYGALHIKTLSLARNTILDLHYRALAGLLDLQWLDLSYNNLTKLSELTFPPFPKLEIIDLRYNPIKYIFPYTFGVMNNTRKMYLGDQNGAMDLATQGSFYSLDLLNYLSILNVSINNLNQFIFQGTNNLEILKLEGSIRRIEYDAFSFMTNLKQLILKKCQIEEISMDAFFVLKKLEIIDLSYNRIAFLPPGIFDDQKNIKEIYLNNNLLQKLPENFFLTTPAKLVRLIDNPWYCSCKMVSWKQGIINSKRTVQKKSKCDFTKNTSKMFKCDKEEEIVYQYDNIFTPRCNGGPEEVKGNTIYHTLRRKLKCSVASNKLLVPSHKNKKEYIKNKYEKQYEFLQKPIKQATNNNNNNNNNQEPIYNTLEKNLKQIRKHEHARKFGQKYNENKHINSLRYQLNNQIKTNNDELQNNI